MHAERRLGELIRSQKETTGLNRGGNPNLPTPTKAEGVATLAQAGIDHKHSSRSQKVAAIPEAKFEGIIGRWLR